MLGHQNMSGTVLDIGVNSEQDGSTKFLQLFLIREIKEAEDTLSLTHLPLLAQARFSTTAWHPLPGCYKNLQPHPEDEKQIPGGNDPPKQAKEGLLHE